MAEHLAFQEWFDWARENLTNREEYRSIDNDEIDMEAALLSAWLHFGVDESNIPLLEIGPAHNPEDITERFVVLNFWYRLSNYEPLLISNADESSRTALRGQLQNLVLLRSIDSCHDAKTLRWEISVACVVQNWVRVKELSNRWEHLDSEMFPRAIIGRAKFLSVYQRVFEPLQWLPSWWMPLTDDFCHGELLSFASGLRIEALGRLLSTEQLDRIYDSISEFEKVSSSPAEGLDPSYRSMLAWCHLAVGKNVDSKGHCLRGAEEYEKLLDKSLSWRVLKDDHVRSMIHSAVVEFL